MDAEANNNFDWKIVEEKAIALITAEREKKSQGVADIEKVEKKNYIIEKEVKRYLSYIKNASHPLSFFNGRISESDLAKYICYLATRNFDKKNRKLIFDLGRERGMKDNFTPLNMKAESFNSFNLSPEIEEKKTRIECDLKGRDAYYNPKIRETDVFDLIHSYWNKSCNGCIDYKKLVIDLLKENDLMYSVLIKEKAEVAKSNLESVYYKRISQYIDFSYNMFSELLFFLILTCWDNQKEWLQEINKRMDDIFTLRHQIEEEIVRYNRAMSKDNTALYQKIVVNENGDTVNPTIQAFGLWIDKKQIYDEEEQIEKVLEEDIKSNKDFFVKSTPFLHSRISDYESDAKLILDLKGKARPSDADYNKLYDAKKFIKIWGEKEGALGNEDDVFLLYIVYREIFINKARLPDKNNNWTALTIAKSIIKDFESGKSCSSVKRWHEVFIHKKLQRGRLCIWGLQEEYFLYNKILQKYRKALLDVFNIPYDIECYRLIYNIGTMSLLFFLI